MVSFFSMIVSQENLKKNYFNLILVKFTERFCALNRRSLFSAVVSVLLFTNPY